MNSLPQVEEQIGIDIGIGVYASDFDWYLYEGLGFKFLERDIPSEEFKEKFSDENIDEFIHHLKLFRDACDRTIKKLQHVRG